ncbi:MAG: NAD(P)-dependent oxidoreductase [Lysinibacillus sp.]
MKKKIAFIGTGVMGASIVKHLLKAGHELTVYNRTKEKTDELVALGAKWAATPAEASEGQDIIFTMVGYPRDVEEVFTGEQGIFRTAKAGAIAVDMTTSEPSLAKRLFDIGRERNVHMMDAPVSGGDIGARNGTLSIMIGGEAEIFDRLLPIFQTFGTNIVYHGPAGAGQHAKMCNQIVIASGMIGVCESMAYGLKAGLSMEDVLKSITSGAAGSWSLSNLAPRMLKGDLEPGFYIKHMVKDIRIAIEEAERMDLQLPGLALAKELYEELQAKGYGEKGTQALIRHYTEG